MNKPLTGKHILITRSKEQAPPFSTLLEGAGAIPVVVPLLTFKRKDSEENRKILQQLHEFTWVFFTSANGVKFFFDYVRSLRIPRTKLSSIRFGVVGRKTDQALQAYGFEAGFQPSHFLGENMAKEFMKQFSVENVNILLINGNLSRDDVRKQLQAEQVKFETCVIYETLINEEETNNLKEQVNSDLVDAYTFTSPSSVEAFMELIQDEQTQIRNIQQEKLCVCIGTTTEQAARSAGFKQIIIPEEFTIDGMVMVLEHYFQEKG
ncbi:uroporphyrinogen-III synthase [Radiobacillus kanasensis]|uniref:uroporphyrinogen-III synthase n=1 Tax=Radiobacillus kanasensis TaxID=2844358 RepID=UPI001E2B8E13|nr:uroporphyrinogen-III synthase [Radiobacillus kanasensis]UFT97950.1 uroporphyrinogen-III synthase [Radiobacillus kanasensis]